LEPQANFDFLRAMVECDDPKDLLNELMTAYGKDVWNYAYSLSRKREMADDITQDVFVKVFRNMHAFRRDASVKTWLLTITRHTAIDYRRSAFFRKAILTDGFEEHGQRKSAEQEVFERFAVNDMWKAVMALPAKYREVLVLYAHYQLSLKEIGELLGVTEGTVKSRMFHARRKLARGKEGNAHG
jgi:RNA polymerase sigma factor (sigma-70 family)